MTESERIELALEGRLSPEDWAQFQADVVADPELRARYAEAAWMHGQLQAERDTLPQLLDEASTAPAPRNLVRLWPPVAWAAAASLATAFIVFQFARPTPPETVAVLAEAKDCKWAGSELPTLEGAQLGAGTLSLLEGMATLAFESGARVTLEAPATLEVLSKMECRLVEGSLVADVPEPAHGFTIHAPDMEVIDRGTRFGLTASRFGHSHVIVFEGEIEVGRDPATRKRLTTGNALHVGQKAAFVAGEIARAPVLENREDGWWSVPTSFGRGKDAYVRREDPHGPTGGHPLIMVKHTDLAAGNERRAFLTFDLAGLQTASQAEAAELVLDVEPSGLGFSALVPDSRFAVYGLVEDALDEWSETDLIWPTAPASTDTGLDAGRVRKLAEFEIKRGAAPGRVTVASTELARFVREDANGLVSLAIVRMTGENDKQGLVHAFATKEHPEAQPPTLRLKLSEQP